MKNRKTLILIRAIFFSILFSQLPILIIGTIYHWNDWITYSPLIVIMGGSFVVSIISIFCDLVFSQ
jgi:hypothetical protein